MKNEYIGCTYLYVHSQIVATSISYHGGGSWLIGSTGHRLNTTGAFFSSSFFYVLLN
jgi:hypothetical protein